MILIFFITQTRFIILRCDKVQFKVGFHAIEGMQMERNAQKVGM